MDISPNQQAFYNNKAVFGWPLLTFKRTPGTFIDVISGKNINLLPFAPSNQNLKLIIPNVQQYDKAVVYTGANAFVMATSTGGGDQFSIDAKLKAYGNVNGGTNPVLLNGAPLPQSFLPQDSTMYFTNILQTLDFQSIDANFSFDLAALQTTPAVTFDPVATDWELFLQLSVKIELYE